MTAEDGPTRDESPATWRAWLHWLLHEASPAERFRLAVLAAWLVACALVILAAFVFAAFVVPGVLR